MSLTGFCIEKVRWKWCVFIILVKLFRCTQTQHTIRLLFLRRVAPSSMLTSPCVTGQRRCALIVRRKEPQSAATASGAWIFTTVHAHWSATVCFSRWELAFRNVHNKLCINRFLRFVLWKIFVISIREPIASYWPLSHSCVAKRSCKAFWIRQLGLTAFCIKYMFLLPFILFLKDKTVLCPTHAVTYTSAPGSNGCDQLCSLAVFRKVYVQRQETKQIASIMQQGELTQGGIKHVLNNGVWKSWHGNFDSNGVSPVYEK